MKKSKSNIVIGTIGATLWGIAWFVNMIAFYIIFRCAVNTTEMTNNNLYLYIMATIFVLYAGFEFIPEMIYGAIELIKKS